MQTLYAAINVKVQQKLTANKFFEKIPEKNTFKNVNEAVKYAEDLLNISISGQTISLLCEPLRF